GIATFLRDAVGHRVLGGGRRRTGVRVGAGLRGRRRIARSLATGAEQRGSQGSSEKARMFESHRFTLGACRGKRRVPRESIVRTVSRSGDKRPADASTGGLRRRC